jgi:hypothetical protein
MSLHSKLIATLPIALVCLLSDVSAAEEQRINIVGPVAQGVNGPESKPKAMWEVVPLTSSEQTIKAGERKTLHFDCTPGSTTLLAFDARISRRKLEGSAAVLELLVNGTPVAAERLVNKELHYTGLGDRTFPYFEIPDRPGKPPCWELFYSPDYESSNLRGPRQIQQGNACSYVFDVTDLVAGKGQNEIVLVNHGDKIRGVSKDSMSIAFRHVKLSLKRSSPGAAGD